MSFTVATYNILANTYIRPTWYPHTPQRMLVAAQRGPALVRHILGLAADVLCLQEVEDDMFEALEVGLRPGGYTGHFAKKARGKPDGCAMFFRTQVFAALDIARVEYLDGAEGHAHSGHIAQLVLLQHAHRTLGIANTHLRKAGLVTRRSSVCEHWPNNA